LWRSVCNRFGRSGGVAGYPLDRLREEVAYIAYHFNWPHDQIMSMEHKERQIWVRQIAGINRRLNDSLRT
jgi:hypothetical protein